jgi:hypothetical protein
VAWIGLAALAAYAVPLWLPPAGGVPPPDPGAGFFGRAFPGVPGAWVVARLLALALGAGALGAVLARYAPARAARGAPPGHGDGARRPLRVGLAAAVAVAGFALAIPWLGRAGQAAWLLLLFAPAAAAFAAGDRRAEAARGSSGAGGPVALWLALALVLSWRSPRAAYLVDAWAAFVAQSEIAAGHRNLLVDGFLPGLAAVNELVQGLPLLVPFGVAPRFPALQVVHLLWAAATALGLARLAARHGSREAGRVAAVAFLFTPFAFVLPLSPAVFFLGPLLTVGLLVLLDLVHDRGSLPALLALAAVGGLAAANPALAPVAALVLATAVVLVTHGGRAPKLALVPAGLVLAAALAPSLLQIPDLPTMLNDYTGGHGRWVELEAVLFGQRTPFDVPEIWSSGSAGALDVPIAAFLAPFAIARQPLRLWGDSLLDPVGAALAAIGLAVALRRLPRSPLARFALAALACAIAPAVLSSYDRPALTRLFAAPAVLALLSAYGFECARRALGPRGRAFSLAVPVAVAVGGTWLVAHVNPRILAGPWMAVALESQHCDGGADGREAWLTWGGPWDLGWLHVEPIARELACRPTPVLPYETGADLPSPDADAPEVLWWSPALGRERGVAAAVCARWPEATLFTVFDAASRAHARAAARDGAWRPAVAEARWRREPCAAPGPG